MFTFKKHKSTGVWSYLDYSSIKVKRKRCGDIAETPTGIYRIMLSVIDTNEKCGWKNITLKAEFDTMQEAKIWLKSMYDEIISKHNLHLTEI